VWNDWKSTHISLDPNWIPNEQRYNEVQGLDKANLVIHYYSNGAFLHGENEILVRVRDIAQIPSVLICGC
jgi:proline iminopeptidase